MTIDKRNGRYRARYRGPDGKERSKTFDLRRAASEWLDEQRGDIARGAWVDPRQARRPFGEWAREWQAAQMHHRPNTVAQVDRALRAHILPTFGHRPIGAIRRTEVQAWVKKLAARPLAPASVQTYYVWFATIMRAAVDDRLIAVSPCRKVNLPEVVTSPITIPTVEQLEAIAGGVDEDGERVGGLPASYRRIVAVLAGTGLRQGEALGLLVDNVDWLRRTVTVDHQQQTKPGGGVELVPVKRPASNRVVPVGQHTLDVLAAQVAEHPPVDGRLWRSSSGAPLERAVFGEAWRKAARAAGCPEVTPHDARHFYASLLIRQGLSVTVVAQHLGHQDATETLRTYSHLWGDDEDRTRAAVDAVLGDPAASTRPDVASDGR